MKNILIVSTWDPNTSVTIDEERKCNFRFLDEFLLTNRNYHLFQCELALALLWFQHLIHFVLFTFTFSSFWIVLLLFNVFASRVLSILNTTICFFFSLISFDLSHWKWMKMFCDWPAYRIKWWTMCIRQVVLRLLFSGKQFSTNSKNSDAHQTFRQPMRT